MTFTVPPVVPGQQTPMLDPPLTHGLFPAGVVTAVVQGDDPGATLYPEEEAHIARAVDRRRREFRTVRSCAAVALGHLGLERPPQVPGAGGASGWPPETVGSMTHCIGLRAAAVALRGRVAALGIDAEPHAPLEPALVADIAGQQERDELARLARIAPQVHWERVLFSAKESVYKVWYPGERRWLGFDDGRVRLSLDGTFTAELSAGPLHLPGRAVTEMVGRWVVRAGMIVTGVSLAA